MAENGFNVNASSPMQGGNGYFNLASGGIGTIITRLNPTVYVAGGGGGGNFGNADSGHAGSNSILARDGVQGGGGGGGGGRDVFSPVGANGGNGGSGYVHFRIAEPGYFLQEQYLKRCKPGHKHRCKSPCKPRRKHRRQCKE